MEIHKVTHGPRKNRFCGPSALSAVTGKLTDETAEMLRKVTGRRSIKGVYDYEMTKAFKAFGYEMKQVFGYTWSQRIKDGFQPLTLAAWLKATPRPAGKVFLVSAGHHYSIVSGRRYVCGQTNEIVSVRDKKVKRRSRVKAVWEITKIRSTPLLQAA